MEVPWNKISVLFNLARVFEQLNKAESASILYRLILFKVHLFFVMQLSTRALLITIVTKLGVIIALSFNLFCHFCVHLYFSCSYFWPNGEFELNIAWNPRYLLELVPVNYNQRPLHSLSIGFVLDALTWCQS